MFASFSFILGFFCGDEKYMKSDTVMCTLYLCVNYGWIDM